MSDGVHSDTIRLAELVGSMTPAAAARSLAGMDWAVRERILRVIEHDRKEPAKAQALRDQIAELKVSRPS